MPIRNSGNQMPPSGKGEGHVPQTLQIYILFGEIQMPIDFSGVKTIVDVKEHGENYTEAPSEET